MHISLTSSLRFALCRVTRKIVPADFVTLARANIHAFCKAFPTVFSLLLLFPFYSFSFAQDNYSQSFDEFTVHYSVFSSTAISAAVAQRYDLVRSKERVYVNIAVVPSSEQFGGVQATVTGNAKNLIQQEKPLVFQEIIEPNAIYYLAPLRHTEREVFHFFITVDPEGPAGPYEVKFTKELFINP